MVKVNNLSNEVEKKLEESREEIKTVLFQKIDKAASDGKKAVQEHLSAGMGVGRRKGVYKDSIKTRTLEEAKYNKNKVIYAEKKEYRLTHLLEKGHLTRNGSSRTKAIEHWKYGQEAIEKIMN